ncbi:replication initiator protein [Dipodfec virus UOA04_Rod_1011]|nr:replication initiator protein [Dipodfec virus UOA04_Rod_1011]
MDKTVNFYDIEDYSSYKRDKSRVNDWSFRVMAETLCHEKNCVLTLTYDDNNLPENGELSLHDYQCFIKNLRKILSPLKIRFFGCGEYGSKGFRPHYHIIIFGWCPDDLVYSHSDNKKIKFYRSKIVADIWKKGFITVCPVVQKEVIPYVCKYLQKFNSFPDKFTKPFITMSRRPGIGYNALESGLIDLNTDKFYLNGKSIRIPRYFLNKLKENELSQERLISCEDGSLDYYVPSEHSTIENTFNIIHTQVDLLLAKRRNFWKNRFDDVKYLSNVVKFKKFSTERDRVRSKDGSALRDRRDGR